MKDIDCFQIVMYMVLVCLHQKKKIIKHVGLITKTLSLLFEYNISFMRSINKSVSYLPKITFCFKQV